MKIAAGLIGAVALATIFCGAARAQDSHEGHEHSTEVGSITVEHAWARAAGSGADTLVFMDIENAGEADELVSASTDIAASATIVGVQHGAEGSTTVELGPIELSAGDTHLDPSGMAIKLTGLTQELAQGDHFELSLQLEHAGEVHIEVEVEAADASQHSHAGHSH